MVPDEIGLEPRERTWVDAHRLPVAVVALESPYRDHCSKSSAIFNERWFDAGGLCLGLADPAWSAAQSRLSTRIAITAGSATGSITELLATELLALLSFIEHRLRPGGRHLDLANPSRSVDKPRLSTHVVTTVGSATGSIS
jgi:hypothetical protein